MLPGGNGQDDVIIIVACISDHHIRSIFWISDGDDTASIPAISPLPRYDDGGVLAESLLVTARLVKFMEHIPIEDVVPPHIWGLWREDSSGGGVLGGTRESSTTSPLPPTSEFFDNISTMGSDITPYSPSSHSNNNGSKY